MLQFAIGRMAYYLGVDIGSVNAQLALIDEDSNVVRLHTERVVSGPRAAVNSAIATLGQQIDLGRVVAAGVSGSGRGAIPEALGWGNYSSSLSIAYGVLHFHPDAQAIVQIGGQTSLVIELEDGLRKPWKAASNPLCAAGTGRFLEQQAYRLGITMEDFAEIALQCQETVPRIAARCSVFAKTDLIHLQQKGVSLEPMLYALCESVARMVGSLKKGSLKEPIYFVGGVAANRAIAKALNEVFSNRNGHPLALVAPDHYSYMEALGAALLSVGKQSNGVLLEEADEKQTYFQMPALEVVEQGAEGKAGTIEHECVAYLGVDVGSTSTKAAIVDDDGNVLAKSYLMTAGRPVEATRQVFRNLLKFGVGKARIAGVGVTGSGRYLVGSFIGADLIKNEITAQTRAAMDLDPEADIIEIGGQDSKLVIKRNGVVVDYQMNKACAAGTGSFIDELAELLGITVGNGEFARLAFAAPYTIDLGTRCAAFMAQSVASAQQNGVSLEVITSSLAIGIARNYLSKVVAGRKLGDKVILTGAVFYNDAVVSAFHRELEGKTLAVPQHKEITGAIGAALLAREQMEGHESRFKGFQQVVDSQVKLTTFTCKGCDNNCTITRMEVPGEQPTFYGSRCDRYDATAGGDGRQETAFGQRERLLFREYGRGAGTGPAVGLPRALLVYDFAPLLIGFLNALGARCVVTGQSTGDVIARAVELSYTDSCFPLKLLHGHAASLADVDYILYPSAIRLARKEGEENQKYACPLVQASPYIVRECVGLGDRLLTPTIDLSRGTEDAITNLADAAATMGFSRRQGRRAAMAGIQAHREFEADQEELGKKVLDGLRGSDKLGVVLFARSYMSQDAGANLGVAEKLAQLGVVPIPIDFLPLKTVDPKRYSDRPYWYYENKYIAAAEITARDPQLYGLALTNFGCGPNSFMLPMVEDIMGDKPLGQLEIDEHAAEAGIVTRLEAFVDTIKGFARSATEVSVQPEEIYRGVPVLEKSNKTFVLPQMSPHARVIGAAMEGYGLNALVLPEPDERNLMYADRVTSGVECLPFRVTLGDFLRFYHEDGRDMSNVEAFMAGAYGPCRFGKYAIEQVKTFHNLGIDLPMRTSVSNNAYRDIELGSNRARMGFMRLTWRACVAMDYLQRLLWRARPYEKRRGAADALFDDYVERLLAHVRRKEDSRDLMREATSRFKDLIDPNAPGRPLVGINGEIYLRSNTFSNQNLVRVCEDAGLEVVVSPMAEWIKYIALRHVEDAVRDRDVKKLVVGYVMKKIQEGMEHDVAAQFRELIKEEEPSTEHILAQSKRWLSSKCGSEAVLSIGSGIDWLENPEYAGVISVMPHGCMPGGIVAAMSEKFSSMYEKPWINVTYDGIAETNNLARIYNFAEIIRFCRRGAAGVA